MADSPPGVNRHPLRRHAVRIATAVVALVLVGAVSYSFAETLGSDALKQREFHARWEYLVPAGVLYLLCHTLWGTFWVQLLRGQGVRISWYAGVRIYFVSQFGKYVPGKAWVILMRVALLRGRGIPPAVVAVTGTYETLTNMAAGAVVGICFLPVGRAGVRLRLEQGVRPARPLRRAGGAGGAEPHGPPRDPKVPRAGRPAAARAVGGPGRPRLRPVARRLVDAGGEPLADGRRRRPRNRAGGKSVCSCKTSRRWPSRMSPASRH